MSIFNINRYKKRIKAFLVTTLLLSTGVVQAQVVIGGNVYGGGKLGVVTENTTVTMNDGTVGKVTYGWKQDTDHAQPKDTIIHEQDAGRLFGGGMGNDVDPNTGRVNGNTTVTINGGHVQNNVYGGGYMASVGLMDTIKEGNTIKDYKPRANTGLARIYFNSGQVGPTPIVDAEHNIPCSVFGLDGYILGGSKGIGNDPDDDYKHFANVNNTEVVVNMVMPTNATDSVNKRIWGSVFGGGEDGHILGNTYVEYRNGLMGPDGSVDYGGNIFGGGRNYNSQWVTCGRVRGNTSVYITGGEILGSVFAGGRSGATGVDLDGNMIDDDENETHGHTSLVMVGGTVGDPVISEVSLHPCGDLFGSGKGHLNNLAFGEVKLAEIIVRDSIDGTDTVSRPTIYRSIYGGGEIARVTKNTTIDIYDGDIKHSVFGGGLGNRANEKAGLVCGNATVNMRGGHVQHSIYGGGELGSVGTFTYNTFTYPDGTPHEGEQVQMATSCTRGTGLTKVLISGGQVGLNNPQMPDPDIVGSEGDDFGYVFCAGKGEADSITYPKAIGLAVADSTYLQISNTTVSETQTLVPLITASVYGGSENGMVLRNTYVKIAGGQIGDGFNHETQKSDGVYDESLWTAAINGIKAGTFNDALAEPFHECDAWPFEYPYSVADIFYEEGVYEPANSAKHGTNGHSYFGNVFGGGSGFYPIDRGIWRRSAGVVKGNTLVEITGGHILTAVYGANEITDVIGKSVIKMSGGTVGVPRVLDSIKKYPVTCSLFGAGMGDPRIWANTWTNVNEVEIDITGGAIFGSVFGGGEEGHVLGDITLTVRDTSSVAGKAPLIGTWGISSVDGNVFGAGRGFSGEALTAGSVGGNIDVNIEGGQMLGSVYGGGRMASVGVYFVPDSIPNPSNPSTNIPHPNYGKFQPGEDHGYITVNIDGGVIGNDNESDAPHNIGGNVYGGSMGRVQKLDSVTENPRWPSLAKVKQSRVNITGGYIKHNVYGGGELGTVHDSAIVVFDASATDTIYGELFGGGYGSDILTATNNDSITALGSFATPAFLAGRVLGHTLVEIKSGRVINNIYGGGEMASVGLFDTSGDDILAIAGTGSTNVIVSGENAKIGVDTLNNDDQVYKFLFEYDEDNPYDHPEGGNVYGAGKGIAIDSANVYKTICNTNSTKVTISNGKIWGSVYGGGADAHVIGNDSVFITDHADIGTKAVTSWDGNVFGGGKGNFSNNTAGRVGGNTYVKMDGGRIVGTIYGGGRLSLTGVDVNGQDSLFLNGSYQYDNVHHGLATIEVGGTTTVIGNSDGDTLLMSDYSVGDIFGSGRGDVENYENYFAGNVANTDINISGSPRIYGAVFGGGEMASIGYWDTISGSSTLGAFATNTGSALITIAGSPVIGTDREYDTSYLSVPGHWTIFDSINGQRRLTHTCTGNVFGGSQGDVDPDSPLWVDFGRSRTATVNINMEPTGHIMSSVFGGGEQGTLSENATVNITGGTIGRPILDDNNDTIYYFGGVYGGGYGTTIVDKHWHDSCYVVNTNDTVFILAPQFAGRVYGNTTVDVSGGKIHENVYGGGDLAIVGCYDTTNYQPVAGTGLATVIVRNGSTIPEIGLAKAYDTDPATDTDDGHVFGAGKGMLNDPDSLFFDYCNTNYTSVSIRGGHIWGSVFGGGADSHVLGNDSVFIHTGADIGTEGISGYDGNVFGGGKGNLSNFAAGRVAGKTYVKMDGGGLKGNIYGGGLVGCVGVGVEGGFDSFITGQVYDSTNHGLTMVELTGGIVGNNANDGLDLLRNPHKVGNVYGAGRGNPDEYVEDDLGRVANAIVNISGTPHVLGSVFGGGQMANVGHWKDYDSRYTTQTGSTRVTIMGSPLVGDSIEFDHDDYAIAIPLPQKTLYDTLNGVRVLGHTCTGNVFGGGQGDIKLVHDVDTVWAEGFEQGHCRTTEVNISGTPNILSSVYGGSEQGAVWGDTKVNIAGGTIGMMGIESDSVKYNDPTTYTHATYSFGNVFGGSYGLDSYVHLHDSTQSVVDTVNAYAGRIYGNSLVDITGGKIRGNVYGGSNLGIVDGNCVVTVGATTNDTIGPLDGTGWNGYVFGGGKGTHEDPLELRKAFANVDSTFITISSGKICGSVFGGGSDSHVLGSTSITIGAGADVGTNGLTTWDGNIFGGGRNFLNTNHSNGRVEGNIMITMVGGTLQGSIFGGGRMALSGVNENGIFPTSSWEPADHGNVTINVSGGKIGNDSDNGVHLLKDNDESVGDIFGSGKGDTKNYMDIVAGCVTNATINITGSPRINGAVFGGGEMASLGWWNDKGEFYNNTGAATITIGRTGEDDNPTIGTYLELEKDYLSDPSEWTVIEEDENHVKKVIHTCTGNVFGGCQGDVDFEDWVPGDPDSWNNWPYMARSKESTVTINGGTIMSSVFGGAEQGTMTGNTRVIINGGTIGSLATASNGDAYYFGDVYGAGYGSDDENEDGEYVTVFGTRIRTDSLSGRTYGNTRVDILNGTLNHDVYGGASFAMIDGTTTVNIGDSIHQPSASDPTIDTVLVSGAATIRNNVYGTNNHKGSPLNNSTVNIFGTAHTTTDSADYIVDDGHGEPTFAIQNVFGGGNFADYNATGKTAYVKIFGCDNTVWRVFGGGDASISPNVNTDIQGGRFYQVYGGGNGERGELYAANINGNVTLAIHGGIVDAFFVGSNQFGEISGTTNVTVDNDGPCGESDIDEFFCGGNFVPITGNVIATISCNNGLHVRNLYGGCNQAVIQDDPATSEKEGNVYLTVEGGHFENVYGGSKGRLNDDPGGFFDASISGDVTLNITGGTIDTVFGGSNKVGSIKGKIIVNIEDAGNNECPLIVHNVYGGGRGAAYEPDSVGFYPQVNVLKGTISKQQKKDAEGNLMFDDVTGDPIFEENSGNVFGGGFGVDAVVNTTTHPHLDPNPNVANGPKVIIGGSTTSTDEATVEGNVYGGGHGAQVIGNPHVILDGSSKVNVEGNVYGGGKQAEVTGNAKVEVK